jgi:hypothetical protein
MPDKNKRSFDSFWGRIDSDTLKRIAKIFGGKSTWRKDECIAFLQSALNDEERIQGVIKMLPPHEYNLLAFLKSMGGEIESSLLKMATYASGIRLPGARFGYLDPFEDALNKFLRSGLIFNRTDYGSPTNLRNYSGAADFIFSDDRILAQVGRPTFQPIELEPAPAPPVTYARIPHLVSMQIISVINAIDALHGLKLTLSHEVRATEARKLAKTLDWKNNELVEGDFVLPDAANFNLGMLRAIGILHVQGNLLVTTPLAAEFIEWPIDHQVRLLASGIIRTINWQETDRFFYGYYSRNSHLGRLALYTLLHCLPPDSPSLYQVEDFDLALFKRIGQHFKLLSFAPRFYQYDKDANVAEINYAKWLSEQRESWLKTERIWVEESLKTWLYFLGIVSLEMHHGKPVAVGLTDLGRAVLHPDRQANLPAKKPLQESNQLPWVVQPNFDVVAYLDHMTSAQLSFLERNAERVNAGEHVAQYRITRESVYRGLESGMSVQEVLASWQRGSGKDLPQNIAVEIREWANLRERLVLYRRADLAEYPNAEARQAAVERGIIGVPVGERFLLITAPLSKAQVKMFYTTLDYSRPPQRSLIIEEDGTVINNSEHSDLMLTARLDEWIEADSAGNMYFTRESIHRAIKGGRPIALLFKLLEERIARIMPPIMQIALRAWSGEPLALSLGNVLVLYSPSPDISYAIQNSALLRPYLRGVLAPGYFLVRQEQAEELQTQLQKFGLDVQLTELPQKTLTRDRKQL